MVSVTIIPLVIATVLGVAYLSVGCCKPRPKHSMRKLRKKYVVPPPLKAVFPNVAIVAFRRTFAAYDNDFSGTVDAQELMDMFKEIGQKISKEQIDEMVKETDLDGDGEISFGEVISRMIACFLCVYRNSLNFNQCIHLTLDYFFASNCDGTVFVHDAPLS